MYCPYCGVDQDTTNITSIEHIIPYALGGSDGLTISTCRKCNNDLGSQVDAPFMESFLIKTRRFLMNLESSKGNPPQLDLGGTSYIDGNEVPLSYVISRETKVLKVSKPSVTKILKDSKTEHWQVSGDPAEVREILEGKLRKEATLGKTVMLEDGTPLRLEDLDRLFAEKTTTFVDPSVRRTIEHDNLIFARFFAKLALAMGHFHLGEPFTRSATGDQLRQTMKAASMDKVALRGHVWPDIERVEGALNLVAKKDRHTLVIVDGEVPVLLMSLFGDIGALILLGDAPQSGLTKISHKGAGWRIALPSRVLKKLTLLEIVADRITVLRKT